MSFLKSLKKILIKSLLSVRKKYSYKQINNLVDNLQNNKFVGKFITIIGENSIYHFVLYLLCSKLNKTLVTLNHDANFEVIKEQIKILNLIIFFVP